MLSETILQFGAGNFLRAFADLFVHQANVQGQNVGRIVVVQSTGDERSKQLNERNGRYHVVIRGLHDGQTVDRMEECHSISRAVPASSHWPDVLEFAKSPDLRYLISNTTEAGYRLDSLDQWLASPPRSFPAKLLQVLSVRWQAGGTPLTIMPCELIENNANRLRSIILKLSDQWELPKIFRQWAGDECSWLTSLVDRIVPGPPHDHPITANDPLALLAEPFALWAIGESANAHPWIVHPAIVRTPDVTPFYLRKVRILNGAHTALLCHVGLDRFTTVLEAMNDGPTAGWLERLLLDEIVPILFDRCAEPELFARQTLERFRNPFLRHRLVDIAQNHGLKKSIRLEPTHREFVDKYKKEPPLLTAALKSDRVGSIPR